MRLYQSEAWLRQQHQVMKRSPKEIAQLCGSTEITVRTWLDKFGLLNHRRNKKR